MLIFLTYGFQRLRAQNPQTQTQPTFRTDSTTANGVAPGYRPTKGTGLVLNIGPGNSACGTVVNYAGGTLTMTASVTNYVYLNSDTSCAPAVKTTAFTANDVQIATVVAGVSTITSVVDDRTVSINQEPGVIPRVVAGASDALVAGDVAGQVVYESGSATAVTLADLTPGWFSYFIANGAGRRHRHSDRLQAFRRRNHDNYGRPPHSRSGLLDNFGRELLLSALLAFGWQQRW